MNDPLKNRIIKLDFRFEQVWTAIGTVPSDEQSFCTPCELVVLI